MQQDDDPSLIYTDVRRRYETFSNWPWNAKVDPFILVNHGFFYTGSAQRTQCYRCHIIVSDWGTGDDIAWKHKQMSPHCPLFLPEGPVTSVPSARMRNGEPGPSSPWTLANRPVSRRHPMRYEENRLSTFDSWVCPVVRPAALAKAGFYFENLKDQTKCFVCYSILGRWNVGDNPWAEHKRVMPTCPFILGQDVGNVAILTGVRSIEFHMPDTSSGMGRNCGPSQSVTMSRSARKPFYSNYNDRLMTYAAWDNDTNHTSSDQLAAAGFYYTGTSDNVRCYYCNGGLRNWKASDDPWTEHCRWFPDCKFVVNNKGTIFVERVKKAQKRFLKKKATEQFLTGGEGCPAAPLPSAPAAPLPSAPASPLPSTPAAPLPSAPASPLPSAPAAPLPSADDEAIEKFLTGRVVKTVADMGFNLTLIHKEARRLCRETEIRNVTTVLLMESIIAVEDAGGFETNDVSSPEPTTGPPKTSAASYIDSLSLSLAEGGISHKEELRRLRDEKACKICMDNDANVVFMECGHLVSCEGCAVSLRKCPLCRKQIRGTVKTFIA